MSFKHLLKPTQQSVLLAAGRRSGVAASATATVGGGGTTPSSVRCYGVHPGNHLTDSIVSHTPIFSHHVSKLLLQGPEKKLILDMTYGAGGHTDLLISHSSGLVDRIVCCDCDRRAYEEAKQVQLNKDKRVIPMLSRFHELPNLLLDNGFRPECFDGIIIDTGCSASQWSDFNRGFCPSQPGLLDLRYDPEREGPTASQILQNIRSEDVLPLIKTYTGLGPNMSKYVANAIVEARHMFHRFLTTKELYEVLRTAATTYCWEKESRITYKRDIGSSSTPSNSKTGGTEVLDEKVIAKRMMRETLVALRMFVNNDINELQFAVNNVARNFLKPETGVLIAIVGTDAETAIMERSLKQAADSAMSEQKIAISESGKKSWLPWHILHHQPLAMADKILYPRLQSARLYAAMLNEWSVEAT